MSKIIPNGTLVFADDWLGRIVDYDHKSKQYFVKSFSALNKVYQLDTQYQVDGKLRCLVEGDFVKIDNPNVQWEVKKLTSTTALLTYGQHSTTYDLDSDTDTVIISNDKKESNPKESVGDTKAPLSVLSGPVIYEVAMGMSEGARKYGRHNYRDTKVKYSTYFDAAMRHLWSAWEGEQIDPASGLPHLSKAMSSLHVLRDAETRGQVIDNRPHGCSGFIEHMNELQMELNKRHPVSAAPFTADGKPPVPYIFDYTTIVVSPDMEL